MTPPPCPRVTEAWVPLRDLAADAQHLALRGTAERQGIRLPESGLDQDCGGESWPLYFAEC